jgi:hypothetical protein
MCAIAAIAVAAFGGEPEAAAFLGLMALIQLVPTVINFRSEVGRALLAFRHIAHSGSATEPPDASN